jgi:hypothetical protein
MAIRYRVVFSMEDATTIGVLVGAAEGSATVVSVETINSDEPVRVTRRGSNKTRVKVYPTNESELTGLCASFLKHLRTINVKTISGLECQAWLRKNNFSARSSGWLMKSLSMAGVLIKQPRVDGRREATYAVKP